jgi:hypothetical protein
MGAGCLAVEREDKTVAFVTHAADADLAGFRDAPVRCAWQYIAMPTAPLIRFQAVIVDNPANPYRLDHFLNVADPDQARCLSRLVQQEVIHFDMYGDEYEYAYAKQIAHQEEMRQRLDAIVRQAIDDYGAIPTEQRDFDAAKTAFQRAFPL